MTKTMNKTFRDAKPEAAALWNQELNGDMTPDNTSKMTTKKVYLNCSRGKHAPYPIRGCDIRVPPYMCPECMKEDEEENYRKYSLKLNVPKAEEMWDTEKNTIPLEEAKTYMSETAHFVCSEGHHFPKTIRVFSKNQKCPICGLDSVAKYPKLVRQWDFKKNKDHDINMTSANSKDDVYWRCKKCGYGWKAQIATRKKSLGRCPCCEERIVVVKGITDLFTLVPELADSYDYDANIGIDPYTLSVTSNIPIHWKCPECGNCWVAAPLSRIEKDGDTYRVRKCPACAGIMRTKSYGEEYPDLLPQFAANLNGCALYDIVTNNDAKKEYFWNCPICGEEFRATVIAMVRARNTASHGCPYCSGKKVLRENSFAALHPEVMDEYDPENVIDPYAVTECSNLYAKWICRNNKEHRWEAPFETRAIGRGGCPVCKDYKYNVMFYELFPELAGYYAKELNERPFYALSANSNDYAMWRCSKGHSFGQAVYHVTRAGKLFCPYCENRLLLKGFNDLATVRQDILEFYDYEKNTCKPEELLINSWDDTVWWKCKEGHSFQASVARMVETTACPICTRRSVVRGVNDAETAYPEITRIWDYDRNIVKPYEVSDRNNDMFYFKCEKGHSYRSRIETVVNHNFECLVCDYTLIQPGVNSLADTDPELCWEISPNEERTPETLSRRLGVSILWQCKECGADYHYPVKERSIGDNSCPFCNGRYTKFGVNSLIDTDPELAKEFSPNNDCSVERVNKNSNYSVRWICPACHGEYWAKLCDREVGDDSCPYCSGRFPLAGYNTLETVMDDIDEVWDDSDGRSYTEFLPSYTYYRNWKCKTCGGVYRMRIKDFVDIWKRGEETCLYCTGKQPLQGFNTLQAVNPEWFSEWSRQDNYIICDPDEILSTYSEPVWWLCKKCDKKYLMSPKERGIYEMRHKIACPYCKGYRRRKRYFL